MEEQRCGRAEMEVWQSRDGGAEVWQSRDGGIEVW